MRCQAFTQKGVQCRNTAGPSGYCHRHGGSSVPKSKPLPTRVPLSHYKVAPAAAATDSGSEVLGCIVVVVAVVFLLAVMMVGGGTGSKQCKEGQPCGRSCISWDKECHK